MIRALALVILAASALFPAPARSPATPACVTVTAPELKLSSSSVKIKTTINDQLASGAKVEFFRPNDTVQPVLAALTNRKGIASFASLPAGHFLVVASEGKLNATISVEVLSSSKHKGGALLLALKPDPALELMRDRLAAANKSPVTYRTQSFAGVVTDESGSTVTGSVIRIWKMGTQDGEPLFERRAGTDRRITVDLPDGVYVELVASTGFRSQVIVFEVAKDAPVQEFKTTLKVASC